MDRGLHQQSSKTRLTGRSGSLCVLALAACLATLAAPVFSQPILEGERFHPATAHHGMVATSHTLATEVALKVLQDGGNAVDAAIAAAFTQNVTEPWRAGVGGDAYLLIYLKGGSEVKALNASGRSPYAGESPVGCH